MKRIRSIPFGLQIVSLSKGLQRRGIDRDTVDLPHVLDRTLTFGENKRILNQYLGRKVYPSEIKGRVSSFELFQKAQEVNSKRSNRSKFQDSRLRANNTFYPDSITQKQYLKWRKAPNRYDIEGVDSKGEW